MAKKLHQFHQFNLWKMSREHVFFFWLEIAGVKKLPLQLIIGLLWLGMNS